MKRKLDIFKRIMSATMILVLLAPNLYADSWISIGTGDIGSGSSAAIIGASPSAAYQGDVLNVEVTGSYTNFDASTTMDFGSDITVNSVTVTDATHLTANISINTSAGTGTRNITATTGGETASGPVFTVNAPSFAITPSSGEQGWTGDITVTGTGSHFINGTTSAVFTGAGITVNSVTVSNATSAVINITIAPTAAMNSRTLTLSTNLGALGTEAISGSFSVTSSGAGVVIDDYEYYADKDYRGMMNYYYQSGSGANEVVIPAPENSVTVVEEGIRSMRVAYPGAVGTQWGGYWGGGLNSETKDLTPYNGVSLWIKGDGTSNTINISLLEADVSGIPQETYVSTSVPLTDTNWHEVQIPFSAFTRDASGNQLDGVFSKVIKGYSLTYRGSQTTAAQHYIDFIVAKNVSESNTPEVTSVTPNNGQNSSTTAVTITGRNFNGVTAVRIGTWPVSSYTVNDSTSISAVIQSGLPANTYHITVTNPYGTSAQTAADQFTVTQASGDIIIDNYEENNRTDARGQMDYYFSSGSQAGETPIADPANSLTTVYEGLKSMQLVYPGSSAGQWGGFWGGGLSAPATDAIDISAANMLVYYVKGDGTDNAARISVAEYKDGTNDESYRALDGHNLKNTASFKEIKVPYTRLWRDEYAGSVKDDNVFSNKVKSYTLVYTGANPTANSSNVDLIKAVNWSGPIIDLLGPSFGPVGITVEVIGRNFGATQGTSTISLNGLISPVVSWSANRIVMIVPSGATSGPVEVTVSGFVSNGVPFTVTTPNPVGPRITAITPNIGPAGTTAVITGTNFLDDPGAANRSTASYHITFGLNRITTNNVLSWSDTSITVIVPNIPDGTYPVQVRSNDKESNFVDFTVGSPSDTEPPTSVFGNSMVKNGADLTLGWTPATDNIGVVGYHIYRGTDPAFTPSAANRIGSSPTTSYTDAGSLTAGDSYYYKVKAYDAAGNESVNASNIGYKLNKHMEYKVAISNIYWISIPNITPYKKARDIAVDIPNATKVSRFNSSTQSYENLEKFLGSWVGTDFNVTTGESYAVVVGSTSEARLVGWYYPYTISIPYNAAISNINWTSIPYNSSYSTVSNVAVTVPNATKIVRFNPQTQLYERWEKFLGTWSGTNFAITPGEGYGIIVNSDSMWLPGVIE